jgi:hypothetical protein
MNIVINRTRIKGEYCEGTLSIDGVRICSTLENAGALAPSGDYPISLIKCKQYSRKMPLLAPEPVEGNLNLESWNLKQRCMQCKRLSFVCMNSTLPCWCPMLKPGNGIHNRLDGSILVGKYNCLNSLIHPRDVFDPLCERIRKSISRGNTVTVTIADPPT